MRGWRHRRAFAYSDSCGCLMVERRPRSCVGQLLQEIHFKKRLSLQQASAVCSAHAAVKAECAAGIGLKSPFVHALTGQKLPSPRPTLGVLAAKGQGRTGLKALGGVQAAGWWCERHAAHPVSNY